MGNPHNSLPDRYPYESFEVSRGAELSYITYAFDTLARGVELAFPVPGVSFSFGMPFYSSYPVMYLYSSSIYPVMYSEKR